MENILKENLEKTFNISFNINNVINEFGNTYFIRLKDLGKSGFLMKVQIKDNIRLLIEVEPDEYGVNFLNNISNSNAEQRKNFIYYWNALKEKDISIEINDKAITKEQFVTLTDNWKKFKISFNKTPYCDENEVDKAEIVCAFVIQICKMVFSILTYDIDDKINLEGYVEGNKYSIISTKYERNRKNREICLKNKGYICSVCGFDFEKKYGEIGKNFIEVHHAIQVSDMGENYAVDPIKDMYPLCSNCHSMIHRKNPPYTIEELKSIIKNNERE